MNDCYRCDFNDIDIGCTCPNSDKWYACPIENKKPENIQALIELSNYHYGVNPIHRNAMLLLKGGFINE